MNDEYVMMNRRLLAKVLSGDYEILDELKHKHLVGEAKRRAEIGDVRGALSKLRDARLNTKYKWSE